MPDFEKVTRGLEWCIRHGSMGGHDCYGYFAYDQNSNACIGRVGDYYKNCPYRDCETGCAVTLARDAIFLLKQQEKQLKEWEKHVPFLAAHEILKGDEDNA